MLNIIKRAWWLMAMIITLCLTDEDVFANAKPKIMELNAKSETEIEINIGSEVYKLSAGILKDEAAAAAARSIFAMIKIDGRNIRTANIFTKSSLPAMVVTDMAKDDDRIELLIGERISGGFLIREALYIDSTLSSGQLHSSYRDYFPIMLCYDSPIVSNGDGTICYESHGEQRLVGGYLYEVLLRLDGNVLRHTINIKRHRMSREWCKDIAYTLKGKVSLYEKIDGKESGILKKGEKLYLYELRYVGGDMAVDTDRGELKPLGQEVWLKVRTQSGKKGWIRLYDKAVLTRKVT